MIGLLAAVTLLASGSASAYSLCNTANYPYAGQSVSVKILKTTTTVFGSTPITIAGTVSIVDGCNFSLNEFTFSGVPSVSVYGGIGNGAQAVKLVATTINAPSSPLTQTLTFITTSGSYVSYQDFSQFRFYDEVNNLLIGTADIPNAVISTSSTTTTAATSSGVSAATSATPSTGTGTGAGSGSGLVFGPGTSSGTGSGSGSGSGSSASASPKPPPAVNSSAMHIGLSATLTAPLAFIIVVASIFV
ncbi:hypothetical protein BSLG_006605 [Batrachochytrium salamandrivorans]|nr:hypothetical protein BSLG_006605 [Batrachochytrium salamandrivorans]